LANILGKLTLEHRLQKPVPYRLATPQVLGLILKSSNY